VLEKGEEGEGWIRLERKRLTCGVHLDEKFSFEEYVESSHKL
jgi:hypothetical protein